MKEFKCSIVTGVLKIEEKHIWSGGGEGGYIPPTNQDRVNRRINTISTIFTSSWELINPIDKTAIW